MNKSDPNILVIGIGNTGRQDDALGWLFLDSLEKYSPAIPIEYRYQLQIEDAELISNYDAVIFVDATKEQTQEGFYFKECFSKKEHGFSTHALHPEAIVYLGKELYQTKTKTFVLGIEGYSWELKIGLSQKAENNLGKAYAYFLSWLNPIYTELK